MANSKPKVSIVIPTYNEATNIEKLVSEIFGAHSSKYNLEVVIVDDNSPDGTGKIADSLKKKYTVVVLHRAGKLGLGSAVIEGFAAAKGDILGVIDADFSHPVSKISELVGPITKNNAQLSIGSRYVKGGDIENWPLKRKIISRGATVISILLTPIKDPMSGFFFLKKEVIKGVKLNARGFKIGLEIIVKGNYKNFVEIPYVFADRKKGKSKLNLKEIWTYLVDVLRLYKYKLL